VFSIAWACRAEFSALNQCLKLQCAPTPLPVGRGRLIHTLLVQHHSNLAASQRGWGLLQLGMRAGVGSQCSHGPSALCAASLCDEGTLTALWCVCRTTTAVLDTYKKDYLDGL
jgi:hypothetical protein